LNHRKILGTLTGLVALAGISYHQVRDPGPDPRDTAIMSGTIIAGEDARRSADATPRDASCDRSAADAEDTVEERSGTTCPEEEG